MKPKALKELRGKFYKKFTEEKLESIPVGKTDGFKTVKVRRLTTNHADTIWSWFENQLKKQQRERGKEVLGGEVRNR